MPSPTTTLTDWKAAPESVRIAVPPPREDALRVVYGVLVRELEEMHERRVLETPGVLEALDEALREAAALKQLRSRLP